MTVEVKILADSISRGDRLTTLELRYPRMMHSELLTHRMFSRCSSSTRAVPLKKQMEKIEENMAIPYWTMNQPGMQGAEADMRVASKATAIWKAMFESVRQGVSALEELGVHKQDAGRALEPWSHISTVLSGTDWRHFMDVRLKPDVFGIMRELAERIRDALLSSTPINKSHPHSPIAKPIPEAFLRWHLPYIAESELEEISNLLESGTLAPNELGWVRVPGLISAARCARVSYLNHGGERDLMKDWELGLRLIKSHHWSPLEHAARPYHGMLGNFTGWAQLRQITEGLVEL